jgi:Tol biopolymer transport system component/DNA-binding winged helix-turn-helix (wHTH) protein
MSQQPKGIYEFGPFRLDAAERLLLRQGEVTPLTPKAFDLLLALVERRGHLVEKDELFKAVWPDAFVEESNLSSNIALIRKALGDGENGQKYIETVPKRGYRLVAEVREIVDQSKNTGQERLDSQGALSEELARKSLMPIAALPARRAAYHAIKRHKIAAAFALAITAIAGFGLYQLVGRNASETGVSSSVPRIIPLTSFPGSEAHPIFSPDGSQIAFVWCANNNCDIYIKQIDTGGMLRLTNHPGRDYSAVWSPDGRNLAFLRDAGPVCEVYITPSLGGSERKLAEVVNERFPINFQLMDWSPDGRFLAIQDKSSPQEPISIFSMDIETGEKRRLTTPHTRGFGDLYPAFAPDGKTIAFIRSSGANVLDIHLIPVTGGEARQLTFSGVVVRGLSWTPDGSEIVFTVGSGKSKGMWRIPVAGGEPRLVISLGVTVDCPAIARRGARLAFSQLLWDANIWRLELGNTSAAPARLIASTVVDYSPDYSPDGGRIAFASDRSGSMEIWVCDSEGQRPAQVTFLDASSGSPRWSPDGRQIAFDSTAEGNADIFVINAGGGKPRRLTSDPAEDITPSWSRDGRWIYFGSTRSGTLQVWKMPAEGGQAFQVTKGGGFEGVESSDGQFFYYAKGREVAGIWRIATSGGEETPVLDVHRAGFWRFWDLTEKGIYFATAEAPDRRLIEFYDFTTGKVTQIAKLDKPLPTMAGGLTISPDGRWLIWPQLDQVGSDIMLMENFR